MGHEFASLRACKHWSLVTLEIWLILNDVRNWEETGPGYKQQAASFKQGLTAGPGYDRIDLERINYDTTRHRYKSISTGENSKRFRRDPAPGEGRSGTNEKIKWLEELTARWF